MVAQYWPEEGKEEDYGGMIVTSVKQNMYAHFILRVFKITHQVCNPCIYNHWFSYACILLSKWIFLPHRKTDWLVNIGPWYMYDITIIASVDVTERKLNIYVVSDNAKTSTF